MYFSVLNTHIHVEDVLSTFNNLKTKFFMTDDNDDGESQLVLNELEKIDDDCDRHGIQFVKIDDPKAAKEFGIDTTPSIVYFEKKIPNLYDGKYLR